VLFGLLAIASCGRGDFGECCTGDGGGSSGDGANVPPFVPWWTSGTRFRARLVGVGDGGDPIWMGWRDTQLDTDCQGTTAADGTERCVPYHTRADQFYSDAACTQPLAWMHPTMCSYDTYAFIPDAMNRTHVVPLGSVYSGPVYTPNPCTLASAPSPGMLYTTGAEVSATMFAPTQYFTKKVGNYLHQLSGYTDGASVELNALAFNTASCRPQGGVGSGTTRCMPQGLDTLVPVYSDSACTQRAFYSAAGQVPTGQLVVNETAMCGTGYSLWDVGSNTTAANYWTLAPTGCQMQTTGTGTLFTATAAVDSYPTGTVAPGPRRGRLGKLYWTADDGVAMALADWDNDLGRSCWPFIAQDGMLRCLPRHARVVNAYPDGACATTLGTVVASCYNGLDPIDGPSYSSCEDGPWTVNTLPPIAAASYLDEATCTALGPAYDPNGNTGNLPAAMFAPLALTIE
jgi:hypothetical protein